MNLSALLAALAIIESSDAKHPAGNDLARGKRGEVSRYQIMPATWRAYGGGALVNARDPAKARVVALKIVKSFRAEKDFMSEENQVACCAVLWNRGNLNLHSLWLKMNRDLERPNCYSRRVWREYQAIVRR